MGTTPTAEVIAMMMAVIMQLSLDDWGSGFRTSVFWFTGIKSLLHDRLCGAEP